MSFDIAVVPPGLIQQLSPGDGNGAFGMRMVESPLATMEVHTGGRLKPAWDIYRGHHYTVEKIYERRPCAFLIDSSILRLSITARPERPEYGLRVSDLIDQSRMVLAACS